MSVFIKLPTSPSSPPQNGQATALPSNANTSAAMAMTPLALVAMARITLLVSYKKPSDPLVPALHLDDTLARGSNGAP